MTAFKYYLGLDMGTNSVGWAATDPEYRLLKKGCPTTEKEKVAEKTPQKRVKVIVENAAETAIETVRQK